MYIKYDEHDLLELFESEPSSITGNIEDGELIYSYQDNQNFEVILTLDVYGQSCNLSITYNEFVVFTGDFFNVTSLKKTNNDMIIYVEDEARADVKFSKQVGVELL